MTIKIKPVKSSTYLEDKQIVLLLKDKILIFLIILSIELQKNYKPLTQALKNSKDTPRPPPFNI